MSPAKARWRDMVIGVSLALAILTAWLAIHVGAVFLIDWSTTPHWLAVPLILTQTWLCVGLFIVAHDCMHGSLAPGHPKVNRWFGRVALALYAAFSYDRLLPKHYRHHRRPGTPDDPDFRPDGSDAVVPWFLHFVRQYYGWREFVAMGAAMAVYVLIVGAGPGKVLLFYALPAVLSAVQLFYFGTYRPHRVGEGEPFTDRHRSRTDAFPVAMSLLTCFHFGYHHEHHVTPTTPWWRLPSAHRAMKAGLAPRTA